MGTSITTWTNVSAYFTFANHPLALVLFTCGVAGIVIKLIHFIIKHEKEAFKNMK